MASDGRPNAAAGHSEQNNFFTQNAECAACLDVAGLGRV